MLLLPSPPQDQFPRGTRARSPRRLHNRQATCLSDAPLWLTTGEKSPTSGKLAGFWIFPSKRKNGAKLPLFRHEKYAGCRKKWTPDLLCQNLSFRSHHCEGTRFLPVTCKKSDLQISLKNPVRKHSFCSVMTPQSGRLAHESWTGTSPKKLCAVKTRLKLLPFAAPERDIESSFMGCSLLSASHEQSFSLHSPTVRTFRSRGPGTPVVGHSVTVWQVFTKGRLKCELFLPSLCICLRKLGSMSHKVCPRRTRARHSTERDLFPAEETPSRSTNIGGGGGGGRHLFPKDPCTPFKPRTTKTGTRGLTPVSGMHRTDTSASRSCGVPTRISDSVTEFSSPLTPRISFHGGQE